MNGRFYAFGEILWDCLPSGRHAGGAPFNVTAHLARMGVPAALISSVGLDDPGEEILAVAGNKHIDTRFVGRARGGLPTGTVVASVDARGNAAYQITQPAAWDEIAVSPEALAEVSEASAFVFGSLATRSPYNSEGLGRLLALRGPLKFFDVNLRPPFVEPASIIALAARADVVKLNDDEVARLAAWMRTGKPEAATPPGPDAVADAAAVLARVTGVTRVCVTMGPNGAALWDRDAPFIHVPAPPTEVKDTVGAGDAFMAGLMIGLTRGVDSRRTLTAACRLGAYVASQPGATPLLPPDMAAGLNAKLGGRPVQPS